MELEYRCEACGKRVEEDDAVWIAPLTREATTGEDGRPYHVECAPAQEEA